MSSIVQYFPENSGSHCGYCKKDASSFSQGMWAFSLNVEDYQDLIDRGWRRSGKYCYKPTMDKTCCPLYTIRCCATNFKLTKSKKKVLKKMQHFLVSGDSQQSSRRASVNEQPSTIDSTKGQSSRDQVDSNASSHTEATTAVKELKKGTGPDPTKPACKKAKQIRMERKLAKSKGSGSNSAPDASSPNIANVKTNLKDFLPHLNPLVEAKHKLEIRLVPSDVRNEEFSRTKDQSLSIYQKYQCAIHNDSLFDCNEDQWKRFLVESPLNLDKHGPGNGYGSFHNQYWLDDKLIAVGVVDILPKCISSVYFYYDPDYGFLSLGIYSALSELYFTTQLQQESPLLEYYYLGFYVHSCPKMRYKAAYDPSDLLCPETYNWIPVEKCLPALDKQAYARLNELNGGSPSAFYDDGRMATLDAVTCLYRHMKVDYGTYKSAKYGYSSSQRGVPSSIVAKEDEQVQEYASLVGRKCATRILLYRPN